SRAVEDPRWSGRCRVRDGRGERVDSAADQMTLEMSEVRSRRDAGTAPGPQKQPGSRWSQLNFLGKDNNATWYILIGPPFALLFLLTAVPLVLSLYTAMLDWNLADPAGAVFVGLQNFLDLAVDQAFWHSMGLTAYQVIAT